MHLTVKPCVVQNSKTLAESKNLTLLRTKPRGEGRVGWCEKQSYTEGVGYWPNSQFFEADWGFPLESTALVSDCNAISESTLCSSLHSWRKPDRSWRLKQRSARFTQHCPGGTVLRCIKESVQIQGKELLKLSVYLPLPSSPSAQARSHAMSHWWLSQTWDPRCTVQRMRTQPLLTTQAWKLDPETQTQESIG